MLTLKIALAATLTVVGPHLLAAVRLWCIGAIR
jgi:hypothetical protein